jgi:acyl-CoA synthetase
VVSGELGLGAVIVVDDIDTVPVVTAGPEGDSSGRALGPSELWLLNSTSGTTGLPKCVMQTINRWAYFHRKAVEFGGLTPDDVWMSLVPAPFGFGLWTSHVSPTLLGAPCVVQSRFDAGAAAEAIEANGVTVLAAVSSQFVMLLDAAGDHDLTSLRVLFTGGEAISAVRAREFEQRTGCRVLNFYGSNETGVLSGTRAEDPLERRITTGGRVIPEMEVRLYDLEGRRIPGDRGEGRPACKGPATTLGYWDDDAANRELFTDDGWMFMGDVVRIDDDGWLAVVARTADFIIRGGKNISAPAVEEEVATHPAVVLAAAVAGPDERLGERVGVFVELRPGAALDLPALTAHLAERGVSKEWWPERLWVLPELPRSSGGKVAKSELKDLVKTLAG